MFRKVAAAILVFGSMLATASLAPFTGILGGPSSSALDSEQLRSAPPDAYLTVEGFVYEADGITPVLGCLVNITDVNTGAWGLTTTDNTYGFYSLYTESFGSPPLSDHVIKVTATKDDRTGWNETLVGNAFIILWIDVSMSRVSQALSLVEGWNFISLVGGGYKASSLGLGVGDVVVGYDSLSQRYNRTYVPGVSHPFKDFWILPSEGYWIYSRAAKTITLECSIPCGAQTRTINVPPSGGWFAFGLASLKTTYKASNVPSWYSGGSVGVVARYTPGLNYNYSVWVPGSPIPKDFYLVPGQGYWVWVTASGTLSYPA